MWLDAVYHCPWMRSRLRLLRRGLRPEQAGPPLWGCRRGRPARGRGRLRRAVQKILLCSCSQAGQFIVSAFWPQCRQVPTADFRMVERGDEEVHFLIREAIPTYWDSNCHERGIGPIHFFSCVNPFHHHLLRGLLHKNLTVSSLQPGRTSRQPDCPCSIGWSKSSKSTPFAVVGFSVSEASSRDGFNHFNSEHAPTQV